ncbi:hypothetical protein SAMN05421676_107154 [Salinibacillus kushneri]|uniref:Uncharacterized protein n=1 Tax=Salinibacillus kushneri TaxID=237682 RepID=A0A1I0GVN7_9BACI|nr:hypothetical protein SAMN05421676_107154 [Salinibacillus kushneri]
MLALLRCSQALAYLLSFILILLFVSSNLIFWGFTVLWNITIGIYGLFKKSPYNSLTLLGVGYVYGVLLLMFYKTCFIM